MSLDDDTTKIASVLAKVNALPAQLRAKMESSLWEQLWIEMVMRRKLRSTKPYLAIELCDFVY